MNDLRKAAEMALEFIEWLCGDDHSVKPQNNALKTREVLRQALAQPEQEPVAWVQPNGEIVVRTDYGGRLYYSEQNVYTAPPKREWVGLTDEEIEEYKWMGQDVITVIKEIQATLKEKNT